jgi:acetyltransferase-like isoleucine patch superfamily enzyme
MLTKARLDPPFPGFLVFHICNLPPFSWIVGRTIGPRTRSVTLADPWILDPSFVQIGRNVTIGFQTTITAHHQTNEGIVIRKVIIEDDVTVGGNSSLLSGTHLKKGSMIGSGALVLPNTVVEENEFWAGVPAKKIGMVNSAGQPKSDTHAEISGKGQSVS